jgi:hypothetical protein
MITFPPSTPFLQPVELLDIAHIFFRVACAQVHSRLLLQQFDHLIYIQNYVKLTSNMLFFRTGIFERLNYTKVYPTLFRRSLCDVLGSLSSADLTIAETVQVRVLTFRLLEVIKTELT